MFGYVAAKPLSAQSSAEFSAGDESQWPKSALPVMALGSKLEPLVGVPAVALQMAACGLLDAPVLASVEAPGLVAVDAPGVVALDAAGLVAADALVAGSDAAVLVAGSKAALLTAGRDAPAVLGRDVCGAVVAPPPPQARTRIANELSSPSGRFAIVPPQRSAPHDLSARKFQQTKQHSPEGLVPVETEARRRSLQPRFMG